MARRGIQRNGIGQDPDIKDSGERVLEDHLGSGLALSISRKASHGCPPPVSGRHVGSKCREDVSLSIARQRKPAIGFLPISAIAAGRHDLVRNRLRTETARQGANPALVGRRISESLPRSCCGSACGALRRL